MVKILEERIEELNKELYEIRAQRDRLNEESFRWAEKRNLLHEEIKNLRLEAESLREKRDALNSEVRRIKILREETRKRYRGKIDQLKSLRSKIREAEAKRPRRSSRSLEHEVETVDWKIQTDSLSLDEEKRLVERVKALESQLVVYREIKGISDEIVKLEDDAKTLREEMNSRREQISEIARQSQKYHEGMIERLEKTKELKTEADEMHKKHVENREKANVFHSKYVELLSRIKSLRKIIREREEEERAKQEADLRKKLERKALSKLRRGEKLTFEEFKILAGQGRI